MMPKTAEIEQIKLWVTHLSDQELAELRRWFAEFDAARWDEQFEDDVRAGRLDALAQAAVAQFDAGQCQEL
jgi:hypothetical protein